MDTVVVGRFVSTTALAAVGSTGVIANLTVGIFTGLSSGAVVAIAQRYGARMDTEVYKSVHTAMAALCRGGCILYYSGLCSYSLVSAGYGHHAGGIA